jgi:hypothetical protein
LAAAVAAAAAAAVAAKHEKELGPTNAQAGHAVVAAVVGAEEFHC